MGVSQNLGSLLGGGPWNKEYGLLGSILGLPSTCKPPNLPGGAVVANVGRHNGLQQQAHGVSNISDP